MRKPLGCRGEGGRALQHRGQRPAGRPHLGGPRSGQRSSRPSARLLSGDSGELVRDTGPRGDNGVLQGSPSWGRGAAGWGPSPEGSILPLAAPSSSSDTANERPPESLTGTEVGDTGGKDQNIQVGSTALEKTVQGTEDVRGDDDLVSNTFHKIPTG